MAYGLGLLRELRINRKKPRGEIVEIMRATKRFAGQDKQSLDQLFGGLLNMIGSGPWPGETRGGGRDIDVFLDDK